MLVVSPCMCSGCAGFYMPGVRNLLAVKRAVMHGTSVVRSSGMSHLIYTISARELQHTV